MRLLLILFLISLITTSITACGPCNSKRKEKYAAVPTQPTLVNGRVTSKNKEFVMIVKAQSIDNYELNIGINWAPIIKKDLSNAEVEEIFRETFEQTWQRVFVKIALDEEPKQLEMQKEKCYQSCKELYNENLLIMAKKLTTLAKECSHEDEQ